MDRILACGLMGLVCALGSVASAQDCGVWLPGPKPPDFSQGFVPQQFVTDGLEIFARVSNPTASADIWRFDGAAWNLMPWDRDTMGEPDAITFENNQLAVAARRLSPLGGSNFELEVAVHTWNGSAWQKFGNLTEQYISCLGMTARLFDLSFFSNAWYVAGEVTGPCSPVDFVYKILPAGSTSIGEAASSGTLKHLETFGGAVYAAGGFASIHNPDTNVNVAASNIARWTGTAWEAVSGGVNGAVLNLALWQENPAQPLSTQLVVAGHFNQAGGTPAEGIAARSQAGHWNALGSGADWPSFPFGSFNGPVPITSLPTAAADTDLIVGGMLTAGGTFIEEFARWTGSAWVSLGIGLNSTPQTVVTYQGQVLAGGGFSGESVAGGERLFGVGRFDGTSWHTLSSDGTDAMVRALFTDDGIVYAGGDFTFMDGVAASHIAANVDGVWESLGSGINGPVLAIAALGGEIIAGGSFSVAGGVTAHNIAAWNGTAWRTLGTGFNNQVQALTVWNNQLVAVGTFIGDSGLQTALPGIAVWNGVQWSKLHPDADIAGAHAVAVHNGLLHFGGEFPGGVARWTGSQLELLGSGVSGGGVYALKSLAGLLYLGGDFLAPHPWIARWTGSEFIPLTNNGGSANFTGGVRSLTATTEELYAGGYFQVNTGLGPVTNNIARWNGVAWRALADSYPEFRVHAVAVNGDRVWAGGEFFGITDGTVSAYIAERTEGPGFAAHPEQQDICSDDGTKTVEFAAEIVADAGTVVRWQKNQVNVNDGLRISGATTQTLSIFGVLPGDAGNYRLRATDECGNEAFSNSAALTFNGCCAGDLNDDDGINLIDAALFADCLAGPQIVASCPNASRAKFDADSDVDLHDAAFFQRSFAGQCP